jgi:predicted ATPase/signal transduction histidine kinase
VGNYVVSEVLGQDHNTLLVRAQQGDRNVLLRRPVREYPTLEDLARLEYGGEVLQGLSLPGVVRLLGVERLSGSVVHVLEDFGGGPLRRLLDTRRLMPAEALDIARKLAQTLGELHQLGLIHKAVEPFNILVHPETREVQLLGFDIASRVTRDTVVATSPRRMEGSLAYLSPEQTGRMNRAVDYRTDFYSLGVTLYEMLVGQVPFRAAEPLGVVHGHIAVAPVPPHILRPEVPLSASTVVLKLLAKNAEDRYQSAFGLVADLSECLERLSGAGEADSFMPGRHDVSATFRLPQKLYGREQEVGTLVAAFERATAGGCEAVLVSGYSGVGKSALVNEIHKPIVRLHGSFSSGKFDQLQNAPYSALIQAFQGLIRERLAESGEVVAALKARLAEALGPNGQVILEVIPELELITGPQPPVTPLGPTETQNRFKLVFQQFVGALATEEHPLAIFLDDLQWADSASLGLIDSLLRDGAVRHLLLIGAYRDNEVHGAHPLALMLTQLRKGQARVSEIALSPLGLADVTGLLSDLVDRPPDAQLGALAELVFQKTEGNPFFVNQFLTSLYERKLLIFNAAAGQWRWNLEHIRREGITANVAQLMAEKIQRLPQATQRALQLAACVGNTFELAMLAVVCEQGARETAADVWTAVREGLVLPIGDAYKYVSVDPDAGHGWDERAHYQFLHDRVQEAAYSLISEGSRQQVHLKLGRLLLANTPEDRLEARIFDIVNQLNLAVELITDPAERRRLAELNLQAARKAKDSTAYTSAERYLRVGVSLLPAEPFQTNYPLAFGLYRQLAECDYVLGRHDEADAGFDRLLHEARSSHDKLDLVMLKFALYMSRGRHMDGLAVGVEGMRLYGVDVDLGPGLGAQVEAELKMLQALMETRTVASLAQLPASSAPEDLERGMLMFQVQGLGAYANPSLFQLLSLKMVRLAIERGAVPGSSIGFMTYAMWSGVAFGDFATSHEFGLAAMALSERLDTPPMRALVTNFYGIYVRPWRAAMSTCLPYLESAYTRYLETGAVFMTAVAAMHIVMARHFQNAELSPTHEYAMRQFEFLHRLRQPDQAVITACFIREMRALMRGPRSLEREEWLRQEVLREKLAHFPLALMHLRLCFLREAYFFQDWEAALGHAKLLEQSVALFFGDPAEAEYRLYHALVLAALPRPATPEETGARRQAMTAHLEKLRHWARYCPENFLARAVLVEAELARLEGNEKAGELYDQAIELAGAHGLVRLQGLANELATRFYLAGGRRKLAQGYLLDAHYLYARWGAMGLVAELRLRYPGLLPRWEPGAWGQDGTPASLDLASVLKASQAISEAIVLEELLKKLMSTLLESAGAQRGVLWVKGDSEAVVEARKVGDGEVLVQLASSEAPEAADSIVRYVERTRKPVVLGDAAHEGPFQKDAYVARTRAKSLLCIPVLKQKKLVALLYLENPLVTEAFTEERCRVLELLAAQAAISLENAKLYDTLDHRVKERTEALRQSNEDLSQTLQRLREMQQRLVVQEKLASLGTLTSGIAHEIRNPLNFITNFAESLVGLTDEMLEELQSHGTQLGVGFMGYLSSMARDLKATAGRIQEHGQRADGIVRSMLEHSRTGSSELREVALNTLVRDYARLAYQGFSSQDPALQVELQTELDASVGTLLLTPQEMGRVVLNLLNNAFYALKEKRRKDPLFQPKVRIQTRVVEGGVELRIWDNGTGISAAQRNRIFEPFFTTKAPGEGVGLGLSISYDIVVRANGGAIHLQSEEGAFTEFIIQLPRR